MTAPDDDLAVRLRVLASDLLPGSELISAILARIERDTATIAELRERVDTVPRIATAEMIETGFASLVLSREWTPPLSSRESIGIMWRHMHEKARPLDASVATSASVETARVP